MHRILTIILLIYPTLIGYKSKLIQNSSLTGKIICIDAGHGGTAKTDLYRRGPTGEREEWINLRVTLLLKEMLEKKGASVILPRTADDAVALADRSKMAHESKADVFLSIHHNATADSKVNFPIIYYHGRASENQAGVALAEHIAKALSEKFYTTKTPVSIVSDHTIFASAGAAVLRGTYGIPAVLAEASFFTNPREERKLKDPEHNRKEAEAYLIALEAFFDSTKKPIKDKSPTLNITPFRGLQEADRMSEVAKNWYQDYQQALALMKTDDTASMHKAYDLFTRSARSFPDSYVARLCHQNRAGLLRKMNRKAEARQEEIRVKEFYVPYNPK